MAGLVAVQPEKTPSFFVNDQKGFFHDFSSGKHGDAFAFLMETEGLTSLKPWNGSRAWQACRCRALAKLSGPRQKAGEPDRRLAMAARLFEANLQQTVGAERAATSLIAG